MDNLLKYALQSGPLQRIRTLQCLPNSIFAPLIGNVNVVGRRLAQKVVRTQGGGETQILISLMVAATK